MSFAIALLRWFDEGRRDLPWRRAPSAYKTLVSEAMLQQTVVATVVPYFERFLARLPTVRHLAVAPEEEVLALWSGLGYYSRARNLRRAAQAIVAEHGGEVPTDETELANLPGVGPYTAAAVAAIAGGRVTFALDGNAARVMARLAAVRRPIEEPAVRRELRARGLALVPHDRPGAFAEAVMELGARVCTVRAPRCEVCPVSRWCEALRAGCAAELPARRPRAARREMPLVAIALAQEDRVLLVQRPREGLLAATWSLPMVPALEGESDRAAARRALAGLGHRAGSAPRPVGVVRHVFSHRDAQVRVLQARAHPKPSAPDGDALTVRWVTRAELPALGVSSFARKLLACVWDDAHRSARISSPTTS